MGRRKRLNAVQKRGQSQGKKQLIDTSNEVNQNNHSTTEENVQFGEDTRGNVMVSNLNHQNDQSQTEQIQEGSHVEPHIAFGSTTKSLGEDNMRRRKRLNAVQKHDQSKGKKQLIDTSNEVNQNNHSTIEENAQFGEDTRGNLMVSNLNHQNGQSQSEQQIQEGSHVAPHIAFGSTTKSLGEDNMGRRRRLNGVQKHGQSKGKKQLIDTSNEVNQNNHPTIEENAQFGEDTRGNLMVSNLNHQNDQSQSEQQIQEGSHVAPHIAFGSTTKSLGEDNMGRRKRLNVVKKRGRSQGKKQLIDTSNEVNQNNHSTTEENAQFGEDTRGNLMVSNLNHQSDQSQSEQQIPEGSHVEPHIAFGITTKSLGEGEKRTRGYTHMSEVWDMPDGEFIVVKVDPLGNPIGLEGKTLSNAIGCLVRRPQCAPINYLSWKDMPEFYITNMLELIQSKFQFVPELTEQTKQILKDNMSCKWRQFKHDLKSKGYDESMTEEEMAANIPDARVDPSQYRDLVHHWCSKKGQEISNINKRNRSKYEDLHCMGTMNLPRLIHEATKAKGVQPSRAEIYIDTRTRKDGSIVTEKAANVIDELKKHMVEEGSSQNLQTTQDFKNWRNDILSKVKGPEKRGRVRCIGKLPHHASSNDSSQNSKMEMRVQKLENLLGNLVSVLQTRFSADQQINDVLQAIAHEVPNAASTPNHSSSNNQQTTSDSS